MGLHGFPYCSRRIEAKSYRQREREWGKNPRNLSAWTGIGGEKIKHYYGQVKTLWVAKEPRGTNS